MVANKTLYIDGAFAWSGGKIDCSGAAGTTAFVEADSQGGVLTVTGTVQSRARIVVENSANLSGTIKTLAPGCDITVQEGGTLTAAFSLTSDSYANTSKITNHGTMNVTGDTTCNYSPVDNDGTITISAGKRLSIYGSINVGGTLYGYYQHDGAVLNMGAGSEVHYSNTFYSLYSEINLLDAGDHKFTGASSVYLSSTHLVAETGADATFTATSGYTTVSMWSCDWETRIDYTAGHANLLTCGKLIADTGTTFTLWPEGDPVTGTWKLLDASQTGSSAPGTIDLPDGGSTNWLLEDLASLAIQGMMHSRSI